MTDTVLCSGTSFYPLIYFINKFKALLCRLGIVLSVGDKRGHHGACLNAREKKHHNLNQSKANA